jgi:hypothetical protein
LSVADTPKRAIFEGLVFDEQDRPVEVVYLGQEPHYVIDDAGFRRHIEAAHIDRQVLGSMQSQIDENKDAVEEGLMRILGRDDLFTKAALGSSLGNFSQQLENGLPPEARQWLGMMGFRVVVDLHGEVLRIEGGGIAPDGDE